MRRSTAIAAGLTTALLVASFSGTAPLDDPTGAALPAGLHLHLPALYLLLAPLFDLWDGVSMLGMRRLQAFFIWSAVVVVLWRIVKGMLGRAGERRDGRTTEPWRVASLLAEIGIIMAGILALALFGLGGLLWHRPMASLVGVPPGEVVVDLHTHTNVSHDVQGTLMRSFDAEAARRWHRRGGFDAFFVTDHNRVDGIPPDGGSSAARPVLCPGEEVSAADQHIVLLGNTDSVPQQRYGDSLPGILRLFHEADSVWGAIAVASIPEYDRNHFHDLDRFAIAGAGGFEVVNAAPKANELSLAHRDSVIALARAYDLPVLGVTDSHGWGATVEGWTLVRLPEAQAPGPSDAQRSDDSLSVRASGHLTAFPPLCRVILGALQHGGYAATQVVERHRLRPDAWWPLWLTPIGVVWESWRSLGVAELVAWLAWIWGIALLVLLEQRWVTVRDRP